MITLLPSGQQRGEGLFMYHRCVCNPRMNKPNNNNLSRSEPMQHKRHTQQASDLLRAPISALAHFYCRVVDQHNTNTTQTKLRSICSAQSCRNSNPGAVSTFPTRVTGELCTGVVK
ncbi:hypothetical protein V1264_012443 [Littorina saxatilis]|uniref:Uncharacterized protein n=1 Tax=Littorina saxatilis TaxID=31220 RepID=A0AAN9BWE9_9CAEN